MEKNVEKLLSQVNYEIHAFRNARQRFSAQLAPDFNIFRVLRSGGIDEVGLSRCFAHLLDPKAGHGQGNIFLDAFLERMEDIGLASIKEWAKVEDFSCVTLEKMIEGGRRIDIVLEFNGGHIGIENKPWAGDQNNQLKDYAEWLSKKNNWLLVYMSNTSPDRSSLLKDKLEEYKQNENFCRFDFRECIVPWLDFCAFRSKSLKVRVFVEELAEFVRSSINEESDMSELNAVQKQMLKNADTTAASLAIVNAWEGAKKTLLKNNLEKDLDKALAGTAFKKCNWLARYDQGKPDSCDFGSYVGFNIGYERLDAQIFFLRFEFDHVSYRSFFWGIKRQSPLTDEDKETREKINEAMKNYFNGGAKSNWWPFYTCAMKDEVGGHTDKENIDEFFWKMVCENKMGKIILEIAEKTYCEAFKGKESLLCQKGGVKPI